MKSLRQTALLLLFVGSLFPACLVECEEPIEPDCACTYILKPVCGEDGNTYPNACEAGCQGVEVVGEGACNDSD